MEAGRFPKWIGTKNGFRLGTEFEHGSGIGLCPEGNPGIGHRMPECAHHGAGHHGIAKIVEGNDEDLQRKTPLLYNTFKNMVREGFEPP